MFMDRAVIFIKAGDGGDGVTRWRREKYEPAGGPAGGDGGRGGSVYMEVDPGLSTLMDFRYRKHYKAANGEHGGSNNRHGRDADDIVIKVPPGTVVRDGESEQILVDLTEPGQRVLIAEGGRGGRGNTHFKNAIRQAPTFAERGEPGLEYQLQLELKLIADVGLVGFPNAGKSTLLSVVSAAKPKIANYPFTTLVPNLGVVDRGNGVSYVMADIPGLIEGAHEGVGLGHEFLRHVERTRLLLHVVDAAGVDGRDPVDDYTTIKEELLRYSAHLAQCPMVVVANKTDLPDAQGHIQELEQAAAGNDHSFFAISAATTAGIEPLMQHVTEQLQALKAEAVQTEVSPEASAVIHRPQALKSPVNRFTVRRDNEEFVVEGEGLERYMRRLDLTSDEVVVHLQRLFERIGLYKRLADMEVPEGATVRVGELEFEYQE